MNTSYGVERKHISEDTFQTSTVSGRSVLSLNRADRLCSSSGFTQMNTLCDFENTLKGAAWLLRLMGISQIWLVWGEFRLVYRICSSCVCLCFVGITMLLFFIFWRFGYFQLSGVNVFCPEI